MLAWSASTSSQRLAPSYTAGPLVSSLRLLTRAVLCCTGLHWAPRLPPTLRSALGKQRPSGSRRTSGATSGNQVAAFIRGSAEADGRRDEGLLDRLSRPTAATPTTAPVSTAPAAPAVDTSKLAALTRSEPAPAAKDPTVSPAPAAEAPRPVDLSKANEKLSGLLGGKKPQP